MYHEEKVINGILHFKTRPNMEWEPMSIYGMTERIIQLQKELIAEKNKPDDAVELLEKIRGDIKEFYSGAR